MPRRAVVAETFDRVEVVAYLGRGDPDPTTEQLNLLAATYVLNGGGVATVRVVDHLLMFPQRPLTAAQAAAIAGLP